LLRARRERPRGRASEQRDEVAPVHSITSSARARRDGGMSRPSALAVGILITNSNLVDCTTGRAWIRISRIKRGAFGRLAARRFSPKLSVPIRLTPALSPHRAG